MNPTSDTSDAQASLREAASEALEQLEQMEGMFRDDAEFMSALNNLRVALTPLENAEMTKTKYSRNIMESAVEIAYTAGCYSFKTPNSRDMMDEYIAWAVAFESQPYEIDLWLELIDAYAMEKLVIEVEQGRAIFDAGSHSIPRSIRSAKNLAAWQSLNDGDWVYLPYHGDSILTKANFINLCNGDITKAYQLFDMCEWQHPKTLIDELGGIEKLLA